MSNPEQHLADPAAGTSPTTNGASVSDLFRVAGRLVPNQLRDELALAKIELQDKGRTVAKGAVLVAVGLVFLALAVIAGVVAVVAGLSKLMEPWLAALLLTLLFLLLVAVLVLVGVKIVKKTLPLVPRRAVVGLRYDLGVLREGSAYTESRVVREMQQEREAKEQQKVEEANTPKQHRAPAPTEEQLRQRLKARREHLKAVRDDAQGRWDTADRTARRFVSRTRSTVRSAPGEARSAFRSTTGTGTADEPRRWQPLAVLAVAGTAFLVFLKKLVSRG